MNEGKEKVPPPTAAELYAEIATVISSMDGVATGDAFRLGGLVKRYGEVCGSEALKPMIESMLDAFTKPPKPKQPWET